MTLSRGDAAHALYLPAVAILLLLTFVADALFPLGAATWLFYLVPVLVAFSSRRAALPIAAALVATVMLMAAFYIAPAGVGRGLALANRIIAAAFCIVLGVFGAAFVRNRADMRRQQWIREGEVGLANAIGGELTTEEIGRAALSYMAGRLGAVAGVMFVRDGEDFRRVASVGVPDAAAMPERLSLRDGLLAQAVAEQRGIVVDPAPEGYLEFGSALGRAQPSRLIIGISRVDSTVNGVFEFGFIGREQEHAADAAAFVDQISRQLGLSIRSGKYRARLQAFLAETQQQAEELQAQGEELRANNEELEAQSRQLLEAQARLEDHQAELESGNVQLEEQTRALEAQRDELARAHASLKTQSAELELASRYKSEFLANMSHELRTPLNSLLIMARLLADNRDGNLSDEQTRFARTIETSGNDLLALINDILDISKIEAGRLELQPRTVRLDAVLAKLRDGFEASAASRGLALTIEADPSAPDAIETDPQRLEQVLKNFLSNAIKFTAAGEVRLEVAMAAGGRITFTVRDTGPGIPLEHQDTIFEAFRQADGTISRKYGGTGLGLSISRELARLLGGSIALDSAPGKGSAFTLDLPLAYDAAAVVPAPAPAPRPAAAGKGQRSAAAPASALPRMVVDDDREALSGDARVILVVEDDPTFARILCDLAHEMGFQCLIAGTADEGALMARQYLPHAVILDMNLPDHTGLSVLDRIKRDTRTRHIPVHVVSVDDDTLAALSSGAVGYLLKPVRRESLVEMLEGLEARMEQRLRRVLVVEDDVRQAESMRDLLASREVETVEAHSAADCLERLGAETFDCMVLDLNLPDMPGLDLLERLSTDESVGFPPVIVYTGRDLSAEEELRLRRYSKSIIVKGAKSPERLLDEVTLFLHQVVAELPEPQQKLLAKALGRDAALDGRRVMIVEDDIRNVYALTSVLEPHGVRVRIARNGREALDELAKSAGGPDAVELVLMDVMMPEMDGLTAMREIRGDPRWRNLPVIALTAKASDRDQQDCLGAGANDYLAKPLDIDKLLSLVRVWMPR